MLLDNIILVVCGIFVGDTIIVRFQSEKKDVNFCNGGRVLSNRPSQKIITFRVRFCSWNFLFHVFQCVLHITIDFYPTLQLGIYSLFNSAHIPPAVHYALVVKYTWMIK